MSYDIEIADEEFNITYNVSPMFYAAIPDKGIRAIYGKTGAEALQILRDMRTYFEENREALKRFEPENGWGTWENTLKCINKMVFASMSHPKEIWEGD